MSYKSNVFTDLTDNLYKMNEVLGKARNDYLSKEAERKHFEANLVLKAPGSSMAERKAYAEADLAYLEFHQALARLEAVYKFQELRFEIIRKEWDGWYLTHKLDGVLIKKGGDGV